MFGFLFERLIRLVEFIELPEPQRKLVNKYKSKYENISDKYFILSDGSIIDVFGEHTQYAIDSGTNIDDLLESGAIRAGGDKTSHIFIEIDKDVNVTGPQFNFIEDKINFLTNGEIRIDFSEAVGGSRGRRINFSSAIKSSYTIPVDEYKDGYISMSKIREIFFGHGNVISKYQLELVG